MKKILPIKDGDTVYAVKLCSCVDKNIPSCAYKTPVVAGNSEKKHCAYVSRKTYDSTDTSDVIGKNIFATFEEAQSEIERRVKQSDENNT